MKIIFYSVVLME